MFTDPEKSNKIPQKVNERLSDMKQRIIRNIWIISSGILFTGFILFLANRLNIWEDEVYTLNTTSRSLHYAVHQSLEFEAQPPLYFIVLTLWRQISGSILFARLFSVIMILLSSYLLFQFVKKHTSNRNTQFLIIGFLTNPFTIWASLEIRLYALVIFLSIVLILLFFKTYLNEDSRLLFRIIFILISLAGLFTQYYIGFLLFANAFVLLSLKKWISLRKYIVDMILPVLSLIFIFYQIQKQAHIHSELYVDISENYFVKAAKFFLHRIFEYLFPVGFSLNTLGFWIYRVIILFLVVFTIKKSRAQVIFKNLTFFSVISVIVFIFFFIILYWMGNVYTSKKYTSILYIPLILTLWYFIIELVKSRFQLSWILLLIIFNLSSALQENKKLYKVQDFKSLASYIVENDTTTQAILTYRNILSEILKEYYQGSNVIVPVPGEFDFEGNFEPTQWEIREDELVTLEESIKNYDSFYLVTEQNEMIGFHEAKLKLINNLKDRYKEEKKVLFKGNLELMLYTGK